MQFNDDNMHLFWCAFISLCKHITDSLFGFFFVVFIKIKTDHFIKLIYILILKIYRDTFTPKIQSPHGDNLTMQDMIFVNEEGSSRATVNHDNSFCEN